MPQYVYLVNALPAYGKAQFILSYPATNLEEIKKFAIDQAIRENGILDTEDWTTSFKGNIHNKYQIIELHISVNVYVKWREQCGTNIYQIKLDEFLEMNRRAALSKMQKDIVHVKTKATIIAHGLTSPSSFFNRLSSDLGGKISAFSTKADIISPEQLEHVATKQIEKVIQRKLNMKKLQEETKRPHLHEAKENYLQEIVFTEYPPCVKIFLSIYQRDRDKNFFKSIGLFSRFFRGKYQEIHLRMKSSEFLTFEKILEYGVKYPQSRTANILQKYFKTYWDEANLKCNLSQKNNPNILDGLIKRDLQPIVKDYLFSSSL